jgi:hypothetical protein
MTRNFDSFAAEYFRDYEALSTHPTREDRLRRLYRASPSSHLEDLLWDDPNEAWILTLALVDRAPNQEALSFVAAGPLEDMLRRHGLGYAHQIAVEASSNARLREALNYVWGWDVFADQVALEVLPLLDPEVRVYWEGVKAAGARGRAASNAEVGKRTRKNRWRPPPTRPKAERIK